MFQIRRRNGQPAQVIMASSLLVVSLTIRADLKVLLGGSATGRECYWAGVLLGGEGSVSGGGRT
jgi:hypothetical protein